MKLRLIPDTVLFRTALVLVAAMLLSAAVALVVGGIQRQETIAHVSAERLSSVVGIAEETLPDMRDQVLRNFSHPRFHVAWGATAIATTDDADGLAEAVRSAVEKSLEGRDVHVTTAPFVPTFESHDGHHHGGHHFQGPHGPPQMAPPSTALNISIRLDDGSWLNAIVPLDHGEPLWRPRFALPLAVALLLVTVAALLAVRRATRPFATFAAAAHRLGLDVGAPPLAEVGPREVRQAAHAFNIMQQRIGRFVLDRTQMLAAISHDLKTPITRLRLRAEFVDDDEQRGKMLADLAEMESMIASTLAFARDDATREPRVRVDLAALVQGLLEDMEALGSDVAYDGPDSLVIEARLGVLKRALANLIDNAIKYGKTARVTLATLGSDAIITIDDDGPGIAEADRERVFAPFVRLEASRSRDTGGSGLGLAVARAAIRAHGGDIGLANRPEGGLRATVVLPSG
jgi:signal transduction histidine kinase